MEPFIIQIFVPSSVHEHCGLVSEVLHQQCVGHVVAGVGGPNDPIELVLSGDGRNLFNVYFREIKVII